jgi:hypothetical protein
MLIEDFNTKFRECVQNEDIQGASDAIMAKLGVTLVDNKEDFIDLLNESGIEADVDMSNSQLTELFIDNTDNHNLLLGASLLSNMDKNADNLTTSSFDDSIGLSDEDVKLSYVVLNENFNNVEDEGYSNVVGLLAGIGGKLLKGGIKRFRNRNQRGQEGSISPEDRRLLAEVQMQKAAIVAQKAKITEQNKKLAIAKKKKNTVIIVTGSLLALASIVIVVLGNRLK